MAAHQGTETSLQHSVDRYRPCGRLPDWESIIRQLQSKAVNFQTFIDSFLLCPTMPGYRLEYASSNRAKCKGPKPCAGSVISKGTMRFGTTVEFQGKQSFAWRHWGCVTKKVLSNVKEQFEKASEVDGYEDMKPEDQAKVDKAWEDGQVADEDIPETARKAEGEPEEEEEEEKPKKVRGKKKAEDGEEKPKKPRAPRAKKAPKADEDAEEEAEEKPKKKRAPPKKTKEVEEEDEEEPPKKKRATKKAAAKEESDGDDAEEDAPKKKRATKPKAPPKKRVTKKKTDDEESGEDFSKDIDAIEAGDNSEVEPEDTPKKKAPAKKPVSKKGKKAAEEKDDVSAAEEGDASDAEAGQKRKKPASKTAAKPVAKKAKAAPRQKKSKAVVEDEGEPMEE